MKSFARWSAAILLVAALFESGSASAQQKKEQAGAQPQAQSQADQQPVFRAGVNFVRVDVIVTDKKGDPVGDLTDKDFQIFEDDKPQTIEQFKLIRADGRQRPGDEPLRDVKSLSDQEVEATRDDVRLFAIFFDDYHTRDISALTVKAPLTQFIQTQLGPKDLVALMYPLTPLDAVIFTRNQGQIARAIQTFEGRKYRYEPRNQFEEQYAHYPTEEVERIRNQVVMTALRGLATHLGSLREGRKAIIYVGEGLGVMLPAQMRNNDSLAAIPQTARPDSPFEDTVSFFNYSDLMLQMQDVYAAANRNNVAIYTLDPRGLATNEFHIDDVVSPDADRRILQQTQDTLRAMAEETDGRAIVGRNDLAKGLAQIVRDSSAYYLMGYNSSLAPADGKFHEIKVKLSERARSRGLQVRARKGYIAPTADDVKRSTAAPKPEAPKPVQQALASIAPMSAVSGRVVRSWIGMSRGDSGKTRVTFVWEPMPVSPGVKREPPGRISLLVANQAGDVIYRGKAVPSVTFDAPPGKIEMRMSIEGAAGDVLDHEQRDVSVPDLATASSLISTPRVFRARTPREAQALAKDPAAVPIVGRDFSRTERVIVRFDAYGDGTPTATLLNTGGQKMADVPVTAAAAGGTHQIDMPLAALAAGEYVIAIAVTGASAETKELVALKVGS